MPLTLIESFYSVSDLGGFWGVGLTIGRGCLHEPRGLETETGADVSLGAACVTSRASAAVAAGYTARLSAVAVVAVIASSSETVAVANVVEHYLL